MRVLGHLLRVDAVGMEELDAGALTQRRRAGAAAPVVAAAMRKVAQVEVPRLLPVVAVLKLSVRLEGREVMVVTAVTALEAQVAMEVEAVTHSTVAGAVVVAMQVCLVQPVVAMAATVEKAEKGHRWGALEVTKEMVGKVTQPTQECLDQVAQASFSLKACG